MSLAVLAGAEAFTDIARFGERKIELLRRFRPYVNGTPSHDHLGDIFATLDARAFQLCFVAWVAALTNAPAEVIAIDGKTSRRSYQKKGSKEAIHIVSAFAARQRIVLCQVKVDEKSNEIVAIPAPLDMMSIEGAVVTIDAAGCQRKVAAKIIEKKADYILALKGNQGTLREDFDVFVDEQKALKYKDTTISTHETLDADHGRIETRNYTVIHDVGWLQARHQWPGLEAVVVVESQREIIGKITNETRFYITSLVLLAEASIVAGAANENAAADGAGNDTTVGAPDKPARPRPNRNRGMLLVNLPRVITGAKHAIFLIVDRGPARIAKKTKAFV
jgi:predicted transposase YbfD/YdcC